jgi:prevent-host-death family protein
MARSATVGSRDLKTRLGHYLNRVRKGESLVVTDRGEPIAEVRPLGARGDASAAKLEALETLGIVRRGSGGRMCRFQAIRSKQSASEAVLRDREERG